MTQGHRPDGGPVIDCHSHLSPRAWSPAGNRRPTDDYDALIELQDKVGVDISVFGHTWFQTPEGMSELDAARAYNDFAAELTDRYKGRLMGLAAAIPFTEEMLLETERAIKQLGLKGVMVNSSVDGEYLDSPRAEPFFSLMEEMDIPVFVHPPRVTIGSEKMETFLLVELVGRPFDTTLSVARFILSGGFERHPQLKMVCAHLGGALAVLPGRLDFAYELRQQAPAGSLNPDALLKPASEYIRNLYFDTMCHHRPGLTAAVETVGLEHMVFGSDYPPVPIPDALKRGIELVHHLPMSDKEKSQILGGNAASLLGLEA